MIRAFQFLFTIALLVSCSNEDKKGKSTNKVNSDTALFSKIDYDQSNVNFTNRIVQDKKMNFMNNLFIYSGAGVGAGDIDNDGLIDLYFASNFGANKLYKNTGDFTFKDITISSKAEDYVGFTTGIIMLDINNDGWLDIYVSKSGFLKEEGGRENLLFVNQKNGTFKEEAKKWGIADPGYTTQSYSLDYDKDGDLDLYVVNYRYDFVNKKTISPVIQSQIEEITTDQLYRNDGTTFTKVTEEAKLRNKTWGHSATIGDFNNDGWDDIYVSNDFFQPDAMYLNQKDGTFKDDVLNGFDHISLNSMGADYGDINNDTYPDLITLDMLAENYARSKENMAAMSTSGFRKLVDIGYHHSYMANMLHINEGNGKFKEIGQLSGVVKTDWSWAPLIADFDNDGLKDIFITNGIDKDYANNDVVGLIKSNYQNKIKMTLDEALELLPSEKLSNYMFKNNGDLSFSNNSKDWGIDDPVFSYGSAYADLDNDGDLDLITNNVDDKAGIYKNNASNGYLQVELKGSDKNLLGIGSKVYIKTKAGLQFQQLYIARGYKSSVSNRIQFGLGEHTSVDEIIVEWPDGKISSQKNVAANQKIVVDYKSAKQEEFTIERFKSNKQIIASNDLGIDYKHQENFHDDYTIQLLLPQMQSTKGTGIAKADVNGDGLDDFFVGNAAGTPASLYIQNAGGKFKATNQALWNKDAEFEDANAQFFDADGDGDQDLYVVSAGYDLAKNSPLLQDRLYLNNGKGTFTYQKSALPSMLISGKSVAVGDYDKDGDLDLFVGGNVIPGKYPLSPRSYLLQNNKGIFKDVTSASDVLSEVGMVSEATFTDYDNDDDLDLLVVGEWMSPTFYTNSDGKFEKAETIEGLENSEGWWFSITAADYDKDGDQDYVLGNLGKNNKFHPSEEKPLYIYAKDFDNNGSFDVALSKINEGKLVPIRGKECSSEQNPFLLDKIDSYKEFASLDMNDIYGEDKLADAFQLIAHNFKSMYVENLGGGKFKAIALENQAQTGPTLSLISQDINKDGHLDIMGVGAIYDAEVETIRYDSNYGYVLLGDGQGNFSYAKEYSPFIHSDSKDLSPIAINGKDHFIVVSNNQPLEIFTYKP